MKIVDLKISNRFPDKCKIADVRDVDTLREAITGDVVLNLAEDIHIEGYPNELIQCFINIFKTVP